METAVSLFIYLFFTQLLHSTRWKGKNDLPVHEFSPHARLATQHQMGRVHGFVKRQRIARVEVLPIAPGSYVIQVPTG